MPVHLTVTIVALAMYLSLFLTEAIIAFALGLSLCRDLSYVCLAVTSYVRLPILLTVTIIAVALGLSFFSDSGPHNIRVRHVSLQ